MYCIMNEALSGEIFKQSFKPFPPEILMELKAANHGEALERLVPLLNGLNDVDYQHSIRVALAAKDVIDFLEREEGDTELSPEGKNKFRLTPEDKSDFLLAALFHDIGKIRIEDPSLTANGKKLSEAEFAVIKTHVRHGHDILKNCAPRAASIAVRHHEFQNKPYPCGNGGNNVARSDIPSVEQRWEKRIKVPERDLTLSRLLAMIDQFDSATDGKRAYKKQASLQDACEEISHSPFFADVESQRVMARLTEFFTKEGACHQPFSRFEVTG